MTVADKNIGHLISETKSFFVSVWNKCIGNSYDKVKIDTRQKEFPYLWNETGNPKFAKWNKVVCIKYFWHELDEMNMYQNTQKAVPEKEKIL